MGSASQLDSARTFAAVVTSRGLGLGRIEAQKFLGELTPEERESLVGDLQSNLDLTQELAQRRDVPFADYVRELVAKGEVADPGADPEVLYRAGFDVGFAASLVESVKATAPAKIV